MHLLILRRQGFNYLVHLQTDIYQQLIIKIDIGYNRVSKEIVIPNLFLIEIRYN